MADYGAKVLRLGRFCVRLRLKEAGIIEHCHFNQRCHRYRIIPRYLQVKPLVDSPAGRKTATTPGFKFLSTRIHRDKKHLQQITKDASNVKTELTKVLPKNEPSEFFQSSSILQTRTTKKCRIRQKAKFEKLGEGNLKRNGTVWVNHWVTNLSDKQLSEQQMRVLDKGLNFSTTNSTSVAVSVIQQVERAIWKGKFEGQTADAIRSKITGVLQKPPHSISNITPTERQTLKDLKSDDSIVIVPADKGRSTVILNKEDYEQKSLQCYQMEILIKSPRRILHLVFRET